MLDTKILQRTFAMAMKLVPWETIALLDNKINYLEVADVVYDLVLKDSSKSMKPILDGVFGIYGATSLASASETARELDISKARVSDVLNTIRLALEISMSDAIESEKRRSELIARLGVLKTAKPKITIRR